MTKEEAIKRLQSLYAWADFYKQNQRHNDWAKTQDQIDNFKEKHNLN